MLEAYLNSIEHTKLLRVTVDNCAGNFKNYAFIKYLTYLVLKGKFEKVILHTMEPGHTFFGPDSRGGSIRRRFHDSDIFCYDDLVRMINSVKNCKTVPITHDQLQNWNGIIEHNSTYLLQSSWIQPSMICMVCEMHTWC